MRLPSVAQNFGSGIPVVGAKRHTKQISKFSVKIRQPSLWPSEHSHLGISLRREPFGENTQGDRFADAGFAADIESFRYDGL
jgi:hypothetical protein